jgi:hypothetical protein
MTTTSLPAVQSNRFRYALPAQRLPQKERTSWVTTEPSGAFQALHRLTTAVAGHPRGAMFTPTTSVKRACFSRTQAV